MTHSVYLVTDAEEDLLQIFNYTGVRDSKEQAETTLHRLEQKILSLETMPHKGNHPPELQRIGITAYRELHAHPYRIIYQVQGQDVYVHCVLDARRDVQDILMQRILR